MTDKQSLHSKTTRGLGWLASSTLLLSVLRIVVVGVMARLLSPADFGVMAAAGIIFEFARLLSESGITQTLIQRPSLSPIQIRTAFTANLLAGTLATILICLAAPWIAHFFQMPTLQNVLYACSLLFPIGAVSAVSSKLLERAHIFRAVATTEVIGFVLGHVGVGVTLALMGFGVWALVGAYLATEAIRSVLLFRAQPHSVRPGIDFATYRDLMKHGAGFGAQKFASIIALKGDYFVVGRMLGPLPLGQYERSYFLMNIANRLLMTPLEKVLFPAFSRVHDNPERMSRAYLQCTAVAALVFMPISAASVVLAPEVIRVVLGGKWGDAVPAFQILAAGLFFRTGYRVSSIVLNSLALVYRGTIAHIAYAILVVGGAFLLVPWGIVGVAVSTLIAIVVMHAIMAGFVLHSIRLPLGQLLASVLPAAVLTVAVTLAVWAAAIGLRAAGVGPLLTLVGAGFVMAVVIGGLALAWPKMLGPHARTALAPTLGGLAKTLRKRKLPARWLERLVA